MCDFAVRFSAIQEFSVRPSVAQEGWRCQCVPATRSSALEQGVHRAERAGGICSVRSPASVCGSSFPRLRLQGGMNGLDFCFTAGLSLFTRTFRDGVFVHWVIRNVLSGAASQVVKRCFWAAGCLLASSSSALRGVGT